MLEKVSEIGAKVEAFKISDEITLEEFKQAFLGKKPFLFFL